MVKRKRKAKYTAPVAQIGVYQQHRDHNLKRASEGFDALTLAEFRAIGQKYFDDDGVILTPAIWSKDQFADTVKRCKKLVVALHKGEAAHPDNIIDHLDDVGETLRLQAKRFFRVTTYTKDMVFAANLYFYGGYLTNIGIFPKLKFRQYMESFFDNAKPPIRTILTEWTDGYRSGNSFPKRARRANELLVEHYTTPTLSRKRK